MLVVYKMASEMRFSQFAVFITSLAVFTACLLVGFRDFLTNLESNRCEMTYMFEYPEYLRVPFSKETSARYPRYALYLYGEGRYADASKSLRLSGIPVLFIPGNAGSHKQVRSLASVSLRKAVGLKHHFNYFSVDFDEDLSGIFGGVLQEQTEFARLCITRILGLYTKATNPPTSVVLIGHSMGGIIARALFSLPNFDVKQVHTIITLGTPQKHAVVSFDPLLVGFYENVNRFWHREALSSKKTLTTLQNITIVSVGGGFRDFLVRSSPVSLSGLVSKSQGLSIVATSIPKTWVSIDHLCLCWCKQLVLVANRALFDIVDPSTHQITSNATYRMGVFHHHFVSNPGTKKFHVRNGKGNIGITPVVVHKRLWRFKGGSHVKSSKRLYAFPIQEAATTYESLVVVTSLDSSRWIFGCQKNSNQSCKNMTNLSYQTQLLPWQETGLKFIQLNLTVFPEFSHFAIYVPQSKAINILWTEYLSANSSIYPVYLPWLFTSQASVLDIGPDSMFVNLTLQSLSKVWKAYIFNIKVTECEEKSLIIGRVYVPWFNENSYNYSNSGSISLAVKLNHPRPRGRRDAVQIHLWLDPKCSYKVAIQHDLYQTLGQIIRFYGVQLPAWTFSIIFLVFVWQLSSISVTSHCSSFFSLIVNLPQSLRVVLLLFQTHFVISQITLAFCVMQGIEGQHDWLPSVHDLRTFDWIIPLIIVISSAVVIATVIYVWIGVFTRFGGFILSFLKLSLKEERAFGLKEAVLAVMCSLVSLLFCGVVGLILALFLCLWKGWKYAATMKSLQNCPAASRDLKHECKLESAANLSLSISSILVLIIVTNAPALAVWAKHFKYSYHLSSDHTALVSAVLVVNSVIFSVPDEVPRSLVYLCFLVGVAVPQASIVPLYLIPYAFCLVLSVLNALRLIKYFNGSSREKDD